MRIILYKDNKETEYEIDSIMLIAIINIPSKKYK